MAVAAAEARMAVGVTLATGNSLGDDDSDECNNDDGGGRTGGYTNIVVGKRSVIPMTRRRGPESPEETRRVSKEPEGTRRNPKKPEDRGHPGGHPEVISRRNGLGQKKWNLT